MPEIKCTKIPPVCPKYRNGKCAAMSKCKYKGCFTNADRIRVMSDEELAKFLCDIRSKRSSRYSCEGCVAEEFCHDGHNGMIDWLQQPAEEESK